MVEDSRYMFLDYRGLLSHSAKGRPIVSCYNMNILSMCRTIGGTISELNSPHGPLYLRKQKVDLVFSI